MWLVAGLGNPGTQYEWTRHNCGFLVIDELARRAGRETRLRECEALTARANIASVDVLLAKPQTFMNLSGSPLAQLARKHGITIPDEVLVISDDFALPFGRLRIRPGGSAGGHNGLKSIIAKLGTDKFPRVRMGIAPDHPISDHAAFVLADFSRAERQPLAEMVERTADAVTDLLQNGIAEAMSRYNG
ncbi:MAG: aminoacyl-tRNA hydrolase [Blastocatellia bacterium]